jgi:hypothetical protein
MTSIPRILWLPRITAIIDWESSATSSTITFAQYPLFIVDHPAWDDEGPLRERKLLSMISYLKQGTTWIQQAASRFHAFANRYGVYLFQQCMQDPLACTVLYDGFFAHAYGKEMEFSADYYGALLDKKGREQLEAETEVRREAVETLGEELIRRN